ncbi:MAG TPA: tRNA pseudouridine(55) synthase TruB [Steroidobacteraceae bacterium]|nr:tRNA pseudouridine(55) synthase TruB [Steroidobacteraceae bacterium]
MSKPGRYYRPIDGILLLDKALGVSSNAALQQVRALFNAAKAGHAGSLDPLASGLLPVCFGQATKVCGRLLSSGKTYRVLVQLGARTESGDGETEVIERAAVPPLDDRAVEAVLAAFLGEQQQVPPMHSALKFEGKRLYELARRGESVEREPRKIVIHRIARVRLEGDELEFDVYCSKGTYIRTLAADIATRLGTIGYVRGLRRLSLDPFNDLPMYTLERLTALAPEARDALLLQADRAFLDLPQVDLADDAVAGLLQGRTVAARQRAAPGELRAYDGRGRFLGMVQGAPDGRVQPVRLFVDVAGG